MSDIELLCKSSLVEIVCSTEEIEKQAANVILCFVDS